MLRASYYILMYLCISSFNLNGQDLLFSQHYNNPLQNNPALTGIFNGKFRIGTAYRNQYFKISPVSRFTLKDIFFDTRVNTVKNDYLAIGAMITDEDFGTARLGKTLGIFSLSYSKLLNYDKYKSLSHYLVFGSQFGYGKFYPDGGDYLFGIQFDKSKQLLDRTINTGEAVVDYKTFPDINIGLMWYASGRYNSIYLGFAGSHINKYDISLLERSQQKMNMRLSLLFGGQINMDDQIQIIPSVNINLQSNIVNAVFGSQIKVRNSISETNAVRFGAFIRGTNSIDKVIISELILSSTYEFKNYTLGLSYDINISSIKKITGMNGAFEIVGIYIWGDNPVKNSLICPTF